MSVLLNCSGCTNGRCVPSPLPKFEVLCVCNPGFSGRADYFDLRVFRNATVELSLACTVSDVGTTVVWSFFLFAYVMRLLLTAVSFFKFHPTKKIRPITKRLMIVDLAATSLAISFGLQKLISPADSVLGTSAAATLTQIFSNLTMNAVWSIHQLEEFKILTNVRTWKQLKDHKLGRLQLQLQAAFVSTYFVIGIVSISALAISKSWIGPFESGMIGILLFRNLGILVWAVFLVVGATKMQQREKSTRNLLMHLEGAERPARVVEFLQKNKQNLKRQFAFAAVLYIIFSLPPLWDQQYINIGITSISLAFTSSLGQVLLRSEHVAQVKKGTTNTTATSSTMGPTKPAKMLIPRHIRSKPKHVRDGDDDAKGNQNTEDDITLTAPSYPPPPPPRPGDKATAKDRQQQQFQRNPAGNAQRGRPEAIIAAYALESSPPPSY